MTTNNALDEIKQRMANLGYNADDIAVSQRSIALDHESAEIDTRDGEFYFLCDVSDYSAAWKIESEVCCVFSNEWISAADNHNGRTYITQNLIECQGKIFLNCPASATTFVFYVVQVGLIANETEND